MNEEMKETDWTNDEKELAKLEAEKPNTLSEYDDARRTFLKQMAVGGAVFGVEMFGGPDVFALLNEAAFIRTEIMNGVEVELTVNGAKSSLTVDSRMTLLDALRERLNLTGSKKGCDHGQCGACTVIVDGRRVLSCLTLAATCEGSEVMSIEGLAKGGELHAVQEAFIKHDGFQCGYCTPGQICSAVAMLEEAKKGDLSYVTADVKQKAEDLKLSDDEIRERMSGNICRCGAYPNIVAAIREVHTRRAQAQIWQFDGENDAVIFATGVDDETF